MLSLCELVKEAECTAARAKLDTLRRSRAALARWQFCEGCDRASRAGGNCEGWRAPTAPAGTVTHAAHDAGASLMGGAGDDDLTVIDELPGTVEAVEVDAAHLATLEHRTMVARWWYREHPAHGELARRIQTRAEALAAAYQSEGPRYAKRLDLAEVLEALRADLVLAAVAAEVCREAREDGDKPPPRPDAEKVRAGLARHWPDAESWRTVRELARLVTDSGAELAPAVAAHLCLALAPLGAFAFELRRVFKLPKGGRVLALDATAEESRAEWEALAAANGRRFVLVSVPPITMPAPTPATYYRTDRLKTGRLWTRTSHGVAFRAEAAGAVRNALMRALYDDKAALAAVAGIITHKPLADALRWGVGLARVASASPAADAAFAADDTHARTVAELAAELTRRGCTLRIGHYGRDERGTNRFEAVDVLALLGAPRPNWGATEADAHAIGAEADALNLARTMSATVQGIARGRHLRRPVRLFLAADFKVAPESSAVPGLIWTAEDATQGQHAPTFEALETRRALVELAERTGRLDPTEGRRVLGCGRKLAERLCREVAKLRGWSERREGAAGRRAYASPETLDRKKFNDFSSMPPHGKGKEQGIAEGGGPCSIDPVSGHRAGIVEDLPIKAPDPGSGSAAEALAPGQPAEPRPPATFEVAKFDGGATVETFALPRYMRRWEDVPSGPACFGAEGSTVETFDDWPKLAHW